MPSRKGRPNKITREVRAAAQKLFVPSFWKATQQRMIEGKEPPQLVALYLAYAYGKPKTEEEPKTTNVSIGALSVLPALGSSPALVAREAPVLQGREAPALQIRTQEGDVSHIETVVLDTRG
jgi:hypothetical protein